MSFCPAKDIHSVYLDNEMPEIYKAEYESHVESCEKCKKDLEKLRAIRSLLQSDSTSISLDSHFMDESFARLQTKLSYSKNVAKSNRPKSNNWSYVVSGIAAAAVFAFIIPLNVGKSPSNATSANVNVASVMSPLHPTISVPTNVSSVLPITATTNVNSSNKVSFNSGRNVLISSKIHERALSSASDENIKSAIAQNVKSVDFLRPEFRDELISIRIAVPGMGESPVVTEITLPREVVSGRF